MKKVGFISVIFVIVIFVVFLFMNKSNDPSLPIENLSSKEVIEKLEESDRKVVEIAVEDDANWYITRIENEGISMADENIKQMIISNG